MRADLTPPKPSTTTGGYRVTVDPRALPALGPAQFGEATGAGFTLSTPQGPLGLHVHAPGVYRLCLGDPAYPDYGLVVGAPQTVGVRVEREEHATHLHVDGPADGAADGTGDVLTLRHDPLTLEVRRGDLTLHTTLDLHMGGGFRIPPLTLGDWTGLSLELEPGEPIYGLGEKFGRLNKRGERVVGWNEDAYGVNAEYAYKNMPFAWSPRGWGLFADTTARVVHGAGYPDWSNRAYTVLAQQRGLNVYLLLGTPAQMLRAYADLTGHAPQVPRWSLGVWMSRAYYRTADEAMEVARTLRERRLPCDVFTLDGRAWLEVETRCTLDFDRARYPDPAGWIRELRSLDYRLCVWEYPLVSVHNEHYAQLAGKGYFLKDAHGEPYVYHWDPAPFGKLLTPLPPSGLIDFTNPEAYRWYQDNHLKLFEIGVDVMKTDFAEQVPEDAHAANGDDGVRHHNAYALLYNRAVYEVTARHGPSGALVWGRAGWSGSQRYALGWGGDPQTDWGGLSGSLHGALSVGLSGVPYTSHDIGGFYGPAPAPELYVRWAQLGMLGSHARFHGTTPREPWHFGPDAEAVVRRWLNLRYRLLPYLEQACQEGAETGLPVMRAMVLACPDEPQAWAFEEQYLLGGALLVAPVLRAGGRGRVYLPRGRWTHLFTGEVHEGGQTLDFTAPLDWIPVFGRHGAALPLGPAVQHTGELPPSPSSTWPDLTWLRFGESETDAALAGGALLRD